MYKELFKIDYNKLNKLKKLPPRDQGHYLPFNSYPHGAPLGGFGTGTIGRSPFGDFNIWHIKVGAHIEEEIKSCCFHSYQKVSGQEKSFSNILTARDFKTTKLERFAKPYQQKDGYYAASYPKAKYTFDNKKQPAKITCEQFSPILPNNYKETSYPIAIFEHTIENKTDKDIEVAIMLSWENMVGWKFEDQRPGVQDNWFSFIKTNHEKQHKFVKKQIAGQTAIGITMGKIKATATKEMDGEISIAALCPKGDKITHQEYFYTQGTGEGLCKQFYTDGTLNNEPPIHKLEHQSIGSAIAVKIKLKGKQTKKIPFVIVWDLPIIHFGQNVDKTKYYTKYFNNKGNNSWKIAQLGLTNYQKWSKEIDKWHKNIIEESKIKKLIANPKSQNNYFKMLINELYFLADGGSFWDAQTGDFGLLECFDYPFYETLDVRFYGSFPLLKFWPEIELKIMEKFSQTITQKINQKIPFNHYADNPNLKLTATQKKDKQIYDFKKIKGACPHDLGSPKHNPFEKIAGYTWQNTNYWKDLNTKFILLVYRDYKFSKNKEFLKKCWPAMLEASEWLLKMDKDKDGIPENEGYPDQTYDNWIMEGVSAYCGSLWLAALTAVIESAELVKDKKAQNKYKNILTKAQKSFEKKLWNKKYYKFCENNDDIMIDQLIGQWYVNFLEQDTILPLDNVSKSLKTIYKYNFRKTNRGKWAAVSGKKKNNRPVDSEQGRDVWVGANFAFCSLLIENNMHKEAEKVLNSLAKIIYNKGFFFRTPEGWDTKGQFTATMYMRPNAIWSLEF